MGYGMNQGAPFGAGPPPGGHHDEGAEQPFMQRGRFGKNNNKPNFKFQGGPQGRQGWYGAGPQDAQKQMHFAGRKRMRNEELDQDLDAMIAREGKPGGDMMQ